MKLCGKSAVGLAATCAAVVALGVALPAVGVQVGASADVLDVPLLVQSAVHNELQARDHPTERFRYVRREVDSDGSRTREIVETPQGELARLMLVNGHRPNASRVRKNWRQLERMISDPKFRRQRFQDQQQILQREDKILREMPAAFYYRYDGEEKNGLVRLYFRPDPNYQPKSHEALILTGMAGTMWLDPRDQRVERIDGTLIHDVTMGWGLVVRLYAGGRFKMEQTRHPGGAWQMSLLSVDFDGREFIFKGVHVHEKEFCRSFERVPDNLSVAEAVSLLRSSIPSRSWGEKQPHPVTRGVR
jgi:hypothetical protein